MSGNGPTNNRRAALRYVAAGVICLLTIFAAHTGLRWYWCAVSFCLAVGVILGRRRIFHAGVTRTVDEVTCRYVPWFEGNAIFLCLVLPTLATASIFASYDPANPSWLLYDGLLLLGVMPLLLFSISSMWLQCFLRFTPSALTVRLAGLRSEATVIPRERILSITPKMIPNGVSGGSLQAEINYQPVELSSDPAKTILLGLQLTVEPANLCRALMAWQEAAADDPDELMARIERILRGHATADV